MLDVVAKRWSGDSSPGGSLDEARVLGELAAAIEAMRSARGALRPRLEKRVAGLRCELARILVRSGREHLATAVWPDASDEQPMDP